VVVVAVVVAVVLATRGNKKNTAQHDPSSPSSAATTTSQSAPTSPGSATTNAEKSTDSTQYDSYFPDTDVRAYLRPAYKFIDSCEKPQGSITICQLDNGLTLEAGSNVSLGRQLSLPGASGSIVSSPHTTWKEQQWTKGDGQGELRTWLGADKSTRPILYWDRNGSVFGIIGIQKGDVTTTNAGALLSTWKSNFQR
jgi:hypothetical protein